MIKDELFNSDAHRKLINARFLHRSGNAVELRPGVLGAAERFEPLRAVVDDQRYTRQRLDVLHDRRSAKGADDRGKRRLDARLSAFSFDRLDEPRLFTADVGPGSSRDGDIEVEPAAENILAEEAALAALGERFLQHHRAVIELAANIDVRHRIGGDRVAGDDHPFDHQMRILFDEQAVLECSRLRLVCVTQQVGRLRRILWHKAPLRSGGKSRPTPAAQLGILHDLRDLVRLHLQRLLGSFVAAGVDVHIDRRGVRLIDIRRQDLDRIHASIFSTLMFS